MTRVMLVVLLCATILGVLAVYGHGEPSQIGIRDIVGRWDMTITDATGSEYPSWFEVTRDGDKLAGRFVGRSGSQRPIKTVEFSGGTLRFSLPTQYERRKDDLSFEGRLVGRHLEGTTSDADGKALKWTAVRAPRLRRRPPPRWRRPLSLFNGRDLTGWRLRNPKAVNSWQSADGAMENTPHSTDIVTERTFKDFKLHVEFKMVEKSNSGVYLRGRYEVQIEDNFGMEPGSLRIGGIYGFITPASNPSKKAGEWQTYDITLIGRRVSVVLNGTKIIDKAEVPGITGGALDSNERRRGPIMLQGDHGKIYYRNIVITRAR